jgi:hypothetical protein
MEISSNRKFFHRAIYFHRERMRILSSVMEHCVTFGNARIEYVDRLGRPGWQGSSVIRTMETIRPG